MALRTGAAYLESLRDDREVWLGGERVSVVDDPRLAPCTREIAAVYDLQHDPAHHDLLTTTTPETSDPCGLAYALPRTTADLLRRRAMIEFLMRRSGGTMGRLPEYMATIVMGLYNARHHLEAVDPAFASRVAAYFEICRDADLCLTHGFTDPQRDRRRPPTEYAALRVVHRGPDGIVLRGAKAVATLAPFANEYLGLTAPRPGIHPEEVIIHSTPLATPGLRIICRESFTQVNPEDHPLSARYDEMDAWMIFDDVFVPNERVYLLDNAAVNAAVFPAVPSAWAFYHILIRQAVKAEVLAGICFAVVDYLGITDHPQAQTTFAEVIGFLETLRVFLFAAEQQPTFSVHGLAIPNQRYTIQGRIHFMQHLPRILQLVRDLCGPSLLMAPSPGDFAHPELGAAVQEFLGGGDPRAPDRFRLLKLAWDLAGDAFGSRQLFFEMYNAGSLSLNQGRLLDGYDTKTLASLARRLANIGPD